MVKHIRLIICRYEWIAAVCTSSDTRAIPSRVTMNDYNHNGDLTPITIPCEGGTVKGTKVERHSISYEFTPISSEERANKRVGMKRRRLSTAAHTRDLVQPPFPDVRSFKQIQVKGIFCWKRSAPLVLSRGRSACSERAPLKLRLRCDRAKDGIRANGDGRSFSFIGSFLSSKDGPRLMYGMLM